MNVSAPPVDGATASAHGNIFMGELAVSSIGAVAVQAAAVSSGGGVQPSPGQAVTGSSIVCGAISCVDDRGAAHLVRARPDNPPPPPHTRPIRGTHAQGAQAAAPDHHLVVHLLHRIQHVGPRLDARAQGLQHIDQRAWPEPGLGPHDLAAAQCHKPRPALIALVHQLAEQPVGAAQAVDIPVALPHEGLDRGGGSHGREWWEGKMGGKKSAGRGVAPA